VFAQAEVKIVASLGRSPAEKDQNQSTQQSWPLALVNLTLLTPSRPPSYCSFLLKCWKRNGRNIEAIILNFFNPSPQPFYLLHT
jgi:hypothetical protein